MRPQELNLLMIFDAIMTEGSITRAAEQLSLTQPAVSNALARMRVAWGEELFIKDGRNIQPTAFANNLWGQIQGPLGSLEHAINQSEFNPATAQRTFRISAADIFVEMIWGPLRKIIEQQAPGINIHAIPNRAVEAANVLKDAEAELAINRYTLSENVIRAEHLLKPKYVVLMRPDHPLANAPLSITDFANTDHLLVSITGDILGPSDQALRVLGLKRRVAMTVNNAANVPNILKNTDLICVIPSIALEQEIFTNELVVLKSPIDTPPTPVSVIWHKRQDNDAGLQWIRRHIVAIIQQRVSSHDKKLGKYLLR
ncbi:LysR family transcriptional regulator [uncultured Pseudoalteromonas sp.]|uniref:LysR family transcriptional regulator n=1 Tax=uncultured Pseudoalteromonas sp. TaxID=114053 RepID=UPI0030C7AA86